LRCPPTSALFPCTTLFRSEFLPEQNGTYALTISHPSKDLAGEYRYHFLSVAYVNVGEPSTLPELQSPLFLQHAPGQHQVGDEVEDRKSTRLNSSHVKISYA